MERRNTILIIDDIEINRDILADIFRDDYEILEAENGKDGIKILSKHFNKIAVVFLDLVMPVMDGFEVLEVLHKKGLNAQVPIIMITGEESVEFEKRGYDYGVVDYIRKPFHQYIVRRIAENVMDLYRYKNNLETLIKNQTSKLEAQNALLKKQAQRLHKMNDTMIDTISNVVEFRNLESGQHVKRIRKFTRCLAEEVVQEYPEYSFIKGDLDVIEQASAMHDIGKIVIPDGILLKPGKLTEEEFNVMKSHTVKGVEMIANIIQLEDSAYYDYCYQICRYHHERYNGMGYPDGLSGEDIPIAAQIVSLADVYDALVSERIYKKAFDKETAYQMIVNGECGVFSPKILKCFSVVKNDFEVLADQYAEHSDKEGVETR